jgi:hypothetical protein
MVVYGAHHEAATQRPLCAGMDRAGLEGWPREGEGGGGIAVATDDACHMHQGRYGLGRWR